MRSEGSYKNRQVKVLSHTHLSKLHERQNDEIRWIFTCRGWSDYCTTVSSHSIPKELQNSKLKLVVFYASCANNRITFQHFPLLLSRQLHGWVHSRLTGGFSFLYDVGSVHAWSVGWFPLFHHASPHYPTSLNISIDIFTLRCFVQLRTNEMCYAGRFRFFNIYPALSLLLNICFRIICGLETIQLPKTK